jgi:hypothetical protein
MTFELATITPAKIDSVNCRSELNGKEHHPAVDLKISFDAPNSILAMFDGWLLTALYHKGNQPADPQGDLAGVEPVSDVPNLRMPFLASPLKWGKEYTGYELTIDYGMGGKSNVVLPDCEVNNVQLAPKEGGTVTVTVRVQTSKGLTEKVLGKLATLVQHDVQILLKAPEVAPDLGAAADGPWPFGDKGAENKPAAPAMKTPEQALAEAMGVAP